MAKVKGVCKNIDDCERAEKREVQEVEKSAPFICEECGKPLSPVKAKTGTSNNKLLFIIVGLVAVLAIGGGTYYFLTKNPVEKTTGTESNGEPKEKPEDETPPEPEPVGNEPYVVIEDGDQNTGTGKGSIRFDYGKYTGAIKNFKAEGTGNFLFYKQHRLSKYDKQERMAEAKDYVVGEFKDNDLINGKWFGEDKQQKGVVLTQELGIP